MAKRGYKGSLVFASWKQNIFVPATKIPACRQAGLLPQLSLRPSEKASGMFQLANTRSRWNLRKAYIYATMYVNIQTMRRFLFLSVISIGVLFTVPSASAAVLFSQPDISGLVNHSGSRFFNLGAGADGTANQIKLKFQEPLETDNRKHFFILFIEEHNNGSYTSLNQRVYSRPPDSEFYNDGTNIFCNLGGIEELIFKFDDFNFSSSKFYRIAMGYTFDSNERACEGRDFVSTGFNFSAKYEADSSGNIFFEIGNNLWPVTL